jgi:TatD DNase family protein
VDRKGIRVTDTHAHLCDPAFDPDRGEVLGRAREAGVTGVIAVGETLEDARKNLQLAGEHPGVLPAAGLYPTFLDARMAEDMVAWIRREGARLISIGEVGLDYWKVKDESNREVQREIFKRFVQLGKELGLPLSVHSRSAGRHVVDLLLAEGAANVQLHAFDGRAAVAQAAVEAGYFFSIPPSVVRSRQKQKLVRALPPASLLVESDSPVLGPDPKERNEPANAFIALKAVAELKGISLEEAGEAIRENERRLFGPRISSHG